MIFNFIRFYSCGILGRPSNNLTAGVVGLANVGKSTFFQAITKSELGNPANYPFATIEPEQAKAIVPSPQLDFLSKLYQSDKKIPATLTIYDIAGLTRGASCGEGLGNKFLNDIRHVDGIYLLVRGFRDDEITHIEGNIDPVRDLSLVQDELVLKDLEWLEGIRERIKKKINRVCKNSSDYETMHKELCLLDKLEGFLYEGRKIYHFKQYWTEEEVNILNKHNFLTAKPSLILLNVTPRDYLMQDNEFLTEINEWVGEHSPGDEVVLFSADFETQINKYVEPNDFEHFKHYCQETLQGDKSKVLGNSSALPDIIIKMRKILNLISFYTCGPQESRQWTVRKGTLAPQAAGIIHTDFEKTFISSNVIKYNDLKSLEPPLQETQLKNQGKIKRGGKQYVIEDNDVVLFKTAGKR